MVVLKSIEKSSTFAWSNGKHPKLALGSLSGKIDANFSNDSILEIIDTFSSEGQSSSLAKINASSKFLDLAWSSDDSVIAGALENGTVEFFSFDKATNELKVINSFKKHSAAVQSLSFSKVNKNLLATGDAKGLINVWDITKVTDASYEPTSTGDSISNVDGVKSISWNNKIGHILASAGSSSGSISIWDFNQKKEILHFNYQHPTSSQKVIFDIVEWHPTSGTTIATASNSDLNPSIILWDLRKTNTPLQVLENNGHSKGILSLDWCSKDSGLLLSSSSDCTVGLWDPEVEKGLIQKYPSRSNWIFKAKFAPGIPDYFAAASHDSVIEVQQLQDLQIDAKIAELQEKQRNSASEQKEEVVKNVEQSEDDFWNSLSSNNQGASSTAAGSSPQSANVKKANQSQTFSLHIPKWLSAEGRRPAASWAFGGKMVRVLSDGKSVSVFTQPHAKDSDKDLKKQYDLLQNALKTKDFNAIISKRSNNAINNNNEEDWGLLDKISLDGKEAFFAEALALDGESDDVKDAEKEDDEEFFEKLEQEKLDLSSIAEKYEFGSDEILKSLVNKDFKAASNSKLNTGDLLEALVIAHVSKNDDLKEKVLNEYFVKKAKTSKASRLLYALSENKFDDLIEKTDVSEWKYVYKAITNYVSDESIQKKFLSALGENLYKAGNRYDALIIYMSSGILEKISSIWVDELKEIEEGLRSSKNSAYEAHLESLTEFVERFSCFANFFDSNNSSNSLIGGNPKIVSIVLEFINVICINGNFDLALNFLNILPSDNADVVTEKQRVLIASGKSQTATTTTQSKYQNFAKNQPQARQINPGPKFVSASLAQTSSVGSIGGIVPPRASITSLDNGKIPSNESIYASVAPIKAGHAKAAMYAPPVQQPLPKASVSHPMSPPIPAANVVQPQVVNPYMPKATIISSNSTPALGNNSASSFATPPPIGRQPIQPQFISTTPVSEVRDSPNKAPADMVSGQKPVGNKHANAGWNDFALPLPDTSTRAKPIGIKKEPSVVNTPVEKLATLPNKPMASHMSTPPPPPKAAMRNLSSKNIAEQAEKVKSRVLSEKSTKYAPLGNISIQNTPVVGTPPIVSPSIVTKKPPMPEHPKFNNPYAPAEVKSPMLTRNSSSNKFAPPPTSNNYGAPSGNAAPVSIPPPPVKRQSNVVSTPPPILNKQPEIAQSIPEHVAAPAESTVILEQENKEIEEDGEAFTETESTTIQEFFLGRLNEVTEGLGDKLGPQIKDTQKRLTILNNHLKQKNLITERVVIEDILKIIGALENQNFEEAKALQSKISNEYPEQAGKWLTGVKRFIGFSEAHSARN